MRRLSMLIALLGMLGVAANAAAHAGHSHKIIGTVKAVHVDMNHVEVTTKDGKTAGFYVNAETKYSKGGAKLSLSDLKPGTRVVVEGKMEGDKTIATSVQVGTVAKPAAHTSQPH